MGLSCGAWRKDVVPGTIWEPALPWEKLFSKTKFRGLTLHLTCGKALLIWTGLNCSQSCPQNLLTESNQVPPQVEVAPCSALIQQDPHPKSLRTYGQIFHRIPRRNFHENIYSLSSWKIQIKKWEMTYFDLIPNAHLYRTGIWTYNFFFFSDGTESKRILLRPSQTITLPKNSCTDWFFGLRCIAF